MIKNNFSTRFFSQLNTAVGTQSMALFRVLFCLFCLSIIKEVYFFSSLFFDDIDSISKNPFPAKLFLLAWAFCASMVCIGFYTRLFATANYLFTIVATSFFTNARIGTFNDDLLRIGSFLLIFMPVTRSFSIDAFIERIRFENSTPKQTSYYNYFFFTFLSLGLLYIGSGITKLCSNMWQQGLGLWMPSTMPYNHWNEAHTLYIDNYWLSVSLNWAVIIWELSFIFLLFNKRLHWLIVIPGIAFHIGIGILFPFPKICLGPIIFYSLFIPDSFWKSLSAKLTASSKTTVVIAENNSKQLILKRFLTAIDYRKKFLFTNGSQLSINNEDYSTKPAAIKLFQSYILTKPLSWLMHLEVFYLFVDYIIDVLINKDHLSANKQPLSFVTLRFKRILFEIFIAYMIFMQAISNGYHIYSHTNVQKQKNTEKNLRARRNNDDLSLKPSNLSRTLFGVNSRGLFIDHSNKGVKNIYAITYFDKNGKEIWLPFFDERGFSSGYNMNMNWPKYSFNTVCVVTNPADSIALKKYTYFWATKNNIQLDSVPMNVYRKQFVYPTAFEVGYHQKLRNTPWQLEGKMLWKQYTFKYTQVLFDSVYKPITKW
jgi:uncharacterized membrane protein YphA (DoxX/SURF4 family)